MSDTTIRDFTVKTGGRSVKVRERSPFLACVAAIKTGRFKGMGLLMRVIDHKIHVSFYCSSERACKRAGKWCE